MARRKEEMKEAFGGWEERIKEEESGEMTKVGGLEAQERSGLGEEARPSRHGGEAPGAQDRVRRALDGAADRRGKRKG